MHINAFQKESAVGTATSTVYQYYSILQSKKTTYLPSPSMLGPVDDNYSYPLLPPPPPHMAFLSILIWKKIQICSWKSKCRKIFLSKICRTQFGIAIKGQCHEIFDQILFGLKHLTWAKTISQNFSFSQRYSQKLTQKCVSKQSLTALKRVFVVID